MIRVLHVLGGLRRGGAETFVMNLYRNIDRNKIQFDFVVHSGEETDYSRQIRELGGRIYVFSPTKNKNLLKIYNQWKELLLEHTEYTIIHSHIRSYASLITHLANINNRKIIVHSHSISNGKGINAVAKWILQYPIRYSADYMFACSDDAGEWLFGKKSLKKDNYFQVKNGIEVDRYKYNKVTRDDYRNRLKLQDNYVLINIASFRKVKNQSFLINLIDQIKEKESSIKLVLVGEGGEKTEIEHMVKSKGLENQVVFLGERGDVPCLLQAADCFLFPSLWEGLGISAIEAQAAGLKTLCSDHIPKEAGVTDLCEFLPLDIDKWQEVVLQKQKERIDTTKQIKQNGYDIGTTVEWLTSFYQKVSCK